jgi:DNA-binding MarR family transcriptional regulator
MSTLRRSIMKKHRNPLKLESFLPYRLSLLSNTVSSNIAATYQDKFGISMPEWRIMAILAEYPNISADEVCQRTRIEKSVVSRAVAKLIARHLLERSFDENDKRRSSLCLSETGLAVYDEVMPVAENFEKKLIEKLTQEERSSLSILLDKLQNEAEIKQSTDRD